MKVCVPAGCVALFFWAGCSAALAQPAGANYDEAKVPEYTLPDPLVLQNGERVSDARAWLDRRRPELLKLFEENMYGRSPAAPKRVLWELTDRSDHALGGAAVRKQVTIYLTGDKGGPRMRLLLYLPAHSSGPVPVFLGLNFAGNQAVAADPGILRSAVWVREGATRTMVKYEATERSRGTAQSRWPVEKILARGYGLATIYYGDIEPDFDGGMRYGIRPRFFPAGRTEPAPDDWGAIGAWAWGLSRGLDYLEQDKAVDARRVVVIGHSRLGKTALWAGAQDPRFAMVISNDSGEGGAALSRRQFGEQVRNLNTVFPYWFCVNYRKFNDREEDLPFDQHELLALIAPRPVYVAVAQQDLWSDPRGQFLAAVAAGPVYRLLGKQALDTDQMPALHEPIMHTIGFHIRAGKHDITDYDWEQYLTFADKQLRGKP